MFNGRATGLVLPFMLAISGLLGQTAVTDDFSDGDFSNDPSWLGDTAYFEITIAGELRLVDSLAGDRCLTTASDIGLEASWEWRCRLDFNPSSSNYLKVYLMSDNPDLKAPLRGYFLRIGGSSSDRISLYRQDLSQAVKIAESTAGWVDAEPLAIALRVTRDSTHHWQVLADTGLAGNFQVVASADDSTHLNSSYFGLCPNYTRTRADRFYFDDFALSGDPYLDTLPPALINYQIPDTATLTLEFSESIDTAIIAVENIRFSDSLEIDSLKVTDAMILIETRQAFRNKQLYGLLLEGISDLAGNVMDTLITFRRVKPEPGDLVINELMPDPSPAVGIPPFDLPEREYIEVFNHMPYAVQLSGWQFQVGTRNIDIPEVQLEPGGFMVFTQEDAVAEFGDTLPLTGLDMPAASLTNSGSKLELLDQYGQSISTVNYDITYYQNQLKAQGGWSLERIFPDIACEDASNWTASRNANGGTPGMPNSVDSSDYNSEAFRLETLSLVDEQTMKISFSRPLPSDQAIQFNSYRVWPDLEISAISWRQEVPWEIELIFDRRMTKSKIYFLSPDPELSACDGMRVDSDTTGFGLPEGPGPGDLLINEVLFNPSPSGFDFVELYNASDKLIDLSALRLGNWDAQAGLSPNAVALSDESRIWLPGQYLVATEDIDVLKQHHKTGEGALFVELSKMPSLPDDNGSLAIQTAALELIDYFEYDEDMHHPLVSDPEGVSLERLSSQRPTRSLDNWHSAAGTVGYATPGYRNSQYLSPSPASLFSLKPQVFSPNMDGLDDLLSISYQMQDDGGIGRFSVWTPEGQLVRVIADNLLLGNEGVIVWDGTADSGSPSAPGIYIVAFEHFSVDEKRSVTRRTCVLSR